MKSCVVPGMVAAVAVAVTTLAGCGGGGGSSAPPAGVAGSKTLAIGNAIAPSDASAAAGTVTPITIDGENDGVPGGETLTQGSPIFLLPNQLPVDIISPSTSSALKILPLKGSTVRPATPTLLPGHIYFRNGGTVIDSGLVMSQNTVVGAAGGDFKRFALAYPAAGATRTIDLLVEGPIEVGLTTAKELQVSGELDFTFELSNGGTLGAGLQSTFPSGSLYILPGDSESFANAFFQVTMSDLTVDAKVPVTLSFGWPGTTKSQIRTTQFLGASQGSTVTLFGSGVDKNSTVVPSTGITSATLSLVK